MTRHREPEGLREGEELVTLSLLDGYKVRWPRETVARDVVQNFFDEVDDFTRVAVHVDDKARTVRVTGPSTFAMDYLRYVGATTKADPARRTAGGFGEGFKVCALVLLRDFKTTLVAASGAWSLRAMLVPTKHGRELCYAVRALAPGERVDGSLVEIGHADEALRAVFRGAKDLFRHPANPRMASPLFVDEARGVGAWRASVSAKGDVFYRKQLRAHLAFARGAAVTFAHDDRIAALEGDRDRRDLRRPITVVRAALRVAPDDAVRALVEHLRPYWMVGHAVLGAAVREAARRKLTFGFSPRWLARSGNRRLDEMAARYGFRVAAKAFGAVGMTTTAARFGASVEPRALTGVEPSRLAVAHELYVALVGKAPEREVLYALDAPDARVQQVTGMRDAVAVPARAFAAPFAEGVADVLHGLCLGPYSRSASDADRLTAVLEGIVRGGPPIEGARLAWESAVAAPAAPPPPLDAEEDFIALSSDPRTVFVRIAGPTGAPPLDALAASLAAMAREAGLRPSINMVDVRSDEDAWSHATPGVPSVWIDTRLVGASRSRPSCALRLTDAGAVDVPLDAAKARFARLAARRPTGPRRRRSVRQHGVYYTALYKHLDRDRASRLRWRRTHDPAAWLVERATYRNSAPDTALTALEGTHGYAGSHFVSRVRDAALTQAAKREVSADVDGVRAWDDDRVRAFCNGVWASLEGRFTALAAALTSVFDGAPAAPRATVLGAVYGALAKGELMATAWHAHPAVTRLPALCATLAALSTTTDHAHAREHALRATATHWKRTLAGADDEAGMAALRETFARAVARYERAERAVLRRGDKADPHVVAEAMRGGKKTPSRSPLLRWSDVSEETVAATRAAWTAAQDAGADEAAAWRACMAVAKKKARWD